MTEAVAKPLVSAVISEPDVAPSQANVELQSKKWFQDRRLIDFLSGSAAGITGKLVELPFDITKIRLQVQPVDQPRVFNGTLDVIRKTLRQEGFFAFYKGGTSPIVGSIMENAILFVSYGQIQRLIRGDSTEELSIFKCGISGMLSGAVVSTVLTPVEFVKCNLQVQRFDKLYNGPLDVIKSALKANGLKGMYKGHLATMSRESFGGFFWFAVYEMVARKLSPDGTKNGAGPLALMFAGSCAGVVFNASLFPADVLKSQMQTESHSNVRKSYSTRFKELLRAEGVRGLYRGFGITMCRAIPANAVIFGTYELVNRSFTNGL